MSRKETDQKETVTRRLVVIRLVTGGLLVLAVISQARVHLLQRGQIMDRARESKRFIVEKKEPAIRGAIYSADGKALSQADDRRILVVDFRKVPHSSGFFMALGAAAGISASELSELANTGHKVVEWNRTFTPSQSEAIQDVKRKWRADGVGTRISSNRAYGLGESASSLVGIYRADGPRLGVEQAMDDRLSGSDGKIIGMVDKEGQYLPMRVDRSTKRKSDGKSVTLTIDSELQQIAYEAIKSAVRARNAKQGAVVMMDPANGNVLACASYPSFDPTKPFRETKEGEIPDGFATAFQASLEPGSTFKIATVAKALDEGVLSSNDLVQCDGDFTVGGRTIHCALHGGTRAHGAVNPEQAIARSCNVAAAQYALRIGTEDFNTFLEDTGILERRPLGLPGEPRPQYDKDAAAPKLHLANVGFGQAINVTPIALASSFCAIANGGVAVKPRLIDRIGEEIQPIHKGKRVLKPQTCETVLDYMRSVIASDRGTGKTLRIPGYDLGGKTGTAQKTNRATKSMKGGGYVANFVGFVPVSSPRAVILVMVDDPQGQEYYGAQVAGPVFLEVAKHAIKRLSIPRGVLPTRFAKMDTDSVAESTKGKSAKTVAPTLTVKSRLVGDRQEAMVIGRRDQPVVRKPKAEDIVDRNSRELVTQRDEREKADPRLKLRKENEDIVRRVTTKVNSTPPKASAKPKEDVSKKAPKKVSPARSTKNSLGGVETSGGSAITIRKENSSKQEPKTGKSTTKTSSPKGQTSTKSVARIGSKAKVTEPTATRKASLNPATQKTSKSDAPRAITQKSTGSRTVSTEASKPEKKASTKSTSAKTTTKSSATKSASVKSSPTEATVAKNTPAVKKAPVKATTSNKTQDRVRQLEQENERLRKLLDSRSGKTTTKKASGKAEAPVRKQNNSKRPSKKQE